MESHSHLGSILLASERSAPEESTKLLLDCRPGDDERLLRNRHDRHMARDFVAPCHQTGETPAWVFPVILTPRAATCRRAYRSFASIGRRASSVSRWGFRETGLRVRYMY